MSKNITNIFDIPPMKTLMLLKYLLCLPQVFRIKRWIWVLKTISLGSNWEFLGVQLGVQKGNWFLPKIQLKVPQEGGLERAGEVFPEMRANPKNLTKIIFSVKVFSRFSPSLVVGLIVWERNTVDCLFTIGKTLDGICLFSSL